MNGRPDVRSLITVLDAAPDGVLLVDADGLIAYANHGIVPLLGYEVEELLGRPIEVLMPERFRGGHVGLRDRYFGAPHLRTMGTAGTLVGQRKDGREIPLDIKLSPVRGAVGPRTVVVMRDITHIKESEARVRAHAAEIERANRALAEALDLKNRFVGMAAHDLRNPLVAIIGYSEMLQSGLVGELTPRQSETLDTILRSAKFMAALIHDILDVAALQAGELQLVREPTDLAALAAAATKLLLPIAAARGITMVTETPDAPATASLDATKIEQVVHNLLSNAIKFSPEGGEVRVVVEDGPQGVTLAVVDHGPGMSAEEVAGIFAPFRKGTARPGGNLESTGLGLAIVKRIVDGHGGRIDVTTALGQGTTFRVTLPRRP